MADFWNAAKGTLSTVAPMLASAVGGPLAGAATGAIVKALGLAPDTKPEDVATAVVGAAPEQLLALKQAEVQFQAQMRQLDIDAAKLTFDDDADARRAQLGLVQAKSFTAYITPFIAVMIAVVWALSNLGIIPTPGDVAATRLDSTAQMIFAFLFGQHRSASLEQMLYNATPKQ